MNEETIITLYCMADDFINTVMKYPVGKAIMAAWTGKRGPKRQLSLAEAITLNIMRFYLRVQDLKTFYRLVRTAYAGYFPHVPNYENFLKAGNASFMGGMVFLKYLLAVKRRESTDGCFFMDSTAVSVCHNHNSSSHRVSKGTVPGG
jgi:hypothetical protein